MSAKHTPGPWRWFGDPKHGGIYLATTHSGRRYVMDFKRHRMQAAQPRFQVNGRMVPASELCTFEVANNDVVGYKAARANPSVYRYDIDGIDHPDARLMEEAPNLLEALEDLVAVQNGPPLVRYETQWAEAMAKAEAAIAKAKGEA